MSAPIPGVHTLHPAIVQGRREYRTLATVITLAAVIAFETVALVFALLKLSEVI